MPSPRFASFVASLFFFTACGPTVDPGADGGVGLGCGETTAFPTLAWSHSTVGVVPGSYRDVYVEFAQDCHRDVDIALSASADGVVDVPATVHVSAESARASVRITGVAEGTITLTATALHEPSGDTVSADIEVVVTADSVPACDGDASGDLAPGGDVSVSSGSLAGASIALPEGAARDDQFHVDAFSAQIACADDVVPDGYRALGPAVTFGPAHARFGRELPVTIPIRLSLLPSGANRGHVEVAYRGPHDAEGRILPITSPHFAGSAGGGTLTFSVPRLGTYQAVVRTEMPERRMREFKFRGILGFSMGGSGSGRIGFGNPDLFDFVAPLGGPTDWTYLLEYMRRYHVGGFCTEDERTADPEGCAMGSSLARVPAPTQLYEHAQHFEQWWYEDGHDGQGGTFNREDYISIFRDLSAMFGNPNTDASADPSAPDIATPGVTEELRLLPNDQRCLPENQVIIESGFYDDEYNPDGSYPVITFCDGAENGDIGTWDPNGTQRMPIEVVVAVDINGNHVRDAGEPVIRNGREPFDDYGLDGKRDRDEMSADGSVYNELTNPDPAGDNFDFQYNPTGTENNWNRDTIDGDPCRPGEAGMAEFFLDVGVDGVMGTDQLDEGGYDSGEGNGCFDRTRGATRMIESSPRYLVSQMDDATVRDLDLFADGGIRDLFNWAVMANITTAGWSARGLPVRFYNDHSALHLDGRPIGAFDYTSVPWAEIGRYTMVRYGDPDADERFIVAGDGGHVGTTQQITDRLNAALSMMAARWPDLDHRRVANDHICAEGSTACDHVNQISLDFTASTGRAGPVSILLPPGYFLEENQNLHYPVVYFLHGYGMEPNDLVALGLLLWAQMASPNVGSERRLPKMILVFPDGRCRNGECLRGTFYTDAPESTPNGAQMQQFLLDLVEYMDANYRTRAAESFEVLE